MKTELNFNAMFSRKAFPLFPRNFTTDGCSEEIKASLQ